METLEQILRRELRRSTLVYLAFPSDEEQLSALEVNLHKIGHTLGSLPSPGERKQYLTQHLAEFLVGVTYVAWNNYDDGTLWHFVEDALGNPGVSQKELAGLYTFAIREFGLDEFTVKEKTLIGPILVHAGIPRLSQAKFLERLVREYKKFDNLSAEDFNELIRRLAKQDVPAKGLDVPTWRFIREAGLFADDLTEKCLEVLDDIAEDGEWDQGGGEGLPTPMLLAIVDKAKEIQLNRKARLKGSSLRLVPAVWLDPSSLEIKLHLPQYEQLLNKPVSWKINDGLEVSTVSAYPELRGLEPRPKEVIIERLARELVISCVEYGEPWNISLFDPDSPISFFRLDGRALPDSGPLPGQEMLALSPVSKRTEGFQLAINGSITHDFIDNGPPTGWSEDPESQEWRILRIDLTGASRISLFQDGLELAESIRYVGQGTPSFGVEDCLVASVEHQGQQVFAALPSIKLPAADSASDSMWSIKVRIDGNKSTATVTVPFSNSPSIFQVDAGLAEGQFSISVEGKRGNAQRLQGYLVPGFRATLNPPVRGLKTSGDGLEVCRYELEHNGIPFSKGTLESDIEVGIRTPSGSDLKVRPPHVEIQVRRGSEVSRHIKAVNFDPEELFDARVYLVWPGSRLDRVVARAGSSDVQSISVKGKESNSPFLVMGELVDTARAAGHLDIIAVYESKESRVAVVRVKDIVSDLSVTDDGLIEFKSTVDSSSLRARGYCLDAPWIEPFDLQPAEGLLRLPKYVLGFGDIGISFEVYDPWVQNSWPEEFVDSGNSAIVRTSHLSDDGSPQACLARWFQDGLHRDRLKELPLNILARLMIDGSMETAQRNRGAVIELAKGLIDGREAALLPHLADLTDSLNSSALDALFELGLVDKKVEQTTKRRVNSSAPFLSLIALDGKYASDKGLLQHIGEQLFGLSIAFEDPKTAIRDLGILSRTELFEDFVKQVRGIDFLGNPDAGRLARTKLGVVPSQPLHRSRLAGIFLDLLAKRGNLENDPMIRPYLDEDNFKELSKKVRRALPSIASEEKGLLMAATRPDSALATMGGNISFVMGLSTALAIVARWAARSEVMAQEYGQLRNLHKRLFELMPALVEYDLVVAELLASCNADSNGGI